MIPPFDIFKLVEDEEPLLIESEQTLEAAMVLINQAARLVGWVTLIQNFGRLCSIGDGHS